MCLYFSDFHEYSFNAIFLLFIVIKQKAFFKGKPAPNFMISSLVLIPCLLDMGKTLITENSANIDIICFYSGKEI